MAYGHCTDGTVLGGENTREKIKRTPRTELVEPDGHFFVDVLHESDSECHQDLGEVVGPSAVAPFVRVLLPPELKRGRGDTLCRSSNDNRPKQLANCKRPASMSDQLVSLTGLM